MRDALRLFVDTYNRHIREHPGASMEVIHGYGSTGVGGEIRKQLQQLLLRYQDRLQFREVPGNPGATRVYPRVPLPGHVDQMADDILEYCRAPRSLEKILGEFSSRNQMEVKDCVKALERGGRLTVVWKGKHRCYQATSPRQ